eukprot:s4132_g3.t1
MKAALNDAANVEMQLALEEELAHHKAAQRMLEHHFVGAQTGYNEMSFLLEATRAEHSQELKALSDRLKRSSAAQEKGEKEVKNLKAQITRLSKACSTLLKKIKPLTAILRTYEEENKALKAQNHALHQELEEQKVLTKELFKLQEGSAQRGAVAGSSNLKVAPPSSSMARPISPGVSLPGALVGNSNFNKVAPALLVGVLWIGEARSLKTRLEETEMKAALNDAANLEMQLALAEELAHHKAAQRMLEHHFVGAQTGYNEMSFLLEATRAEHSEQFKALSDRLKRSSAAQEKAEKEVKNLKTQMTRLSKACSTLLERIKELTSKVRGCQEENKALKGENRALHQELEEQKVLIKELFKLQEGGAQRCQKLLAENHVLQRRLENSQRQVAVLLDDR